MPNKDGTGPNGMGPRTGRRMGRCQNKKQSNNQPQKRNNRQLKNRYK